MAGIGFREVELWRAEIAWERRADGSILVRQTGALPDYPDRLSDRIAHWAAVAPDRIWMAERGPDGAWQRVSYAELWASIRSIGQRLLELGLGPARPLAILSGNSIAHALMALGAQYAGIPSAAVSTGYSLAGDGFGRLREVAAQTTPGAVFADDTDRYAAALRAVFSDLPHLGLRGAGRRLEWRDLISAGDTTQADAAHRATGPDTVAKFMFTSGTTGTPKAVIQTQRMLCSNMAMVLDCYAYLKDEPPVFVDWAPWSHVAAGNKVFNMAIYNGGTYYIDEGKPTPALIGETLRNLREIAPTLYFNVPTGFEAIANAMKADDALRRNFLSRVKMFFYAGAALAQPVWDSLFESEEREIGERIVMTSGLGMTESSPYGLFVTSPNVKAGDLGLPTPGLELKLVPTDGKLEIRYRGPNITPGYWRGAEATAEAFDDDGFFCTGDAVTWIDPADTHQGLRFDGRIAEDFKLATGTFVSVGPLRGRVIAGGAPYVQDVVVTGLNRKEVGALIFPTPAVRTLCDLAADAPLREVLAHPAVVEKFKSLVTDLSLTATGSANRVTRLLLMAEPPSIDLGEVTDKGSINQRAVLKHRDALVQALYDETPGHGVIKP
ncbi:MAG: feruloyl-CoA synthase [Proteobacteria bacterium]|nr:feruloyl-CoA synthase [Pseudomonadota bacterium]